MRNVACTFAGHRQVFAMDLPEKLDTAIEDILATDAEFSFYTGGMGEFDNLCSAAVRRAKRRHPELHIQLLLVLPYMRQDINTNKSFYEDSYDGILVPTELMGVHYKGAIKQRNQWMLDHSDVLLAYIYRDFGGAYEALQYARKRPNLSIINFAEQQEE